MDESKFKLALSEAKDHLIHIDTSIKSTRNKVFYLIGFVFAFTAFFSKDILSGNYFSLQSYICYSAILFATYCIYTAKESLSPKTQGFNGITPKNFEKLDNEKDYELEDLILHSYQELIEINIRVLKDLSNTYKELFLALAYYAAFLFLLGCTWALIPKCFVC